MNKAVKAIIAVVLIGVAIYYMYGQMKKLGYFQGPPPPPQPMQMRPGPVAPNAPAAPAQPAPSTDTAAATQ